MAKGDDLEQRLIDFAVAIILCATNCQTRWLDDTWLGNCFAAAHRQRPITPKPAALRADEISFTSLASATRN